MTTHRRLLKTQQAAEYLSCSPWKLRELVRDEKIPRVLLGDEESVWRFDVRDLDKFIDSRRQLGS
jgi:excisionase family DNA binding protein